MNTTTEPEVSGPAHLQQLCARAGVEFRRDPDHKKLGIPVLVLKGGERVPAPIIRDSGTVGAFIVRHHGAERWVHFADVVGAEMASMISA